MAVVWKGIEYINSRVGLGSIVYIPQTGEKE
jgi:hypothetical protein